MDGTSSAAPKLQVHSEKKSVCTLKYDLYGQCRTHKQTSARTLPKYRHARTIALAETYDYL